MTRSHASMPYVGTLGDSARLRQIVRLWCRCGRAADLDAGGLAAFYGAELAVQTFFDRCRCVVCDGRPESLQVVPDLVQNGGVLRE